MGCDSRACWQGRRPPTTRFLRWVLLALTVSSAQCATKVCTLAGCGEGISATLRTADGKWASGSYELNLRADGTPGTCTLRLPEQLPQGPGIPLYPCGPQTTVMVTTDKKCAFGCDGQACGQQCMWLRGQFVIEVMMYATPSRLEVVLSRDGEQLVAQEVRPAYEESTPNGPECGPVCRQAKVDVAVP